MKIQVPLDWKIDLQHCGSHDNFNALLFRLISKTQGHGVNLERLRDGFPGQVAFFEAWYNNPDPNWYPIEVEI